MPIGIVLVDDHRIFREGVRTLLEQQEGMAVIGEANDGGEAVDLVRTLSPQVVIMDVSMPDVNGIDATQRILDENQEVKVIALSMHAHRRFVQDMLKAGASGYLLKECAFKEMIRAIHMVYDENRIYLSPEITQQMVDDFLHPSREKESPDSSLLTLKEIKVLQLVAGGQTSEQIAKNLDMSRRTVEKYRSRIMDKLRVHSLAELVKFAIREGLTEL